MHKNIKHGRCRYYPPGNGSTAHPWRIMRMPCARPSLPPLLPFFLGNAFRDEGAEIKKSDREGKGRRKDILLLVFYLAFCA